MLYRQGDVFLETAEIPAGAVSRGDVVLADGELTGHQHRMEDPSSAAIFSLRGQTYVRVLSENGTLVHNEHGSITLPRGDYRFWRQREYAPLASRIERSGVRTPLGLTRVVSD